MPKTPFAGSVWRVCVAGRDPTLASASPSRWCDGTFDVLYTAQAEDGAMAEVHAYLTLQPVFPTKVRFHVHKLAVDVGGLLTLADDAALRGVGIEPATYRSRDYARTQAVADAAFFLGFTGLIAPSARWNCRNLMLFGDRLEAGALRLEALGTDPIDWMSWRQRWRP